MTSIVFEGLGYNLHVGTQSRYLGTCSRLGGLSAVFTHCLLDIGLDEHEREHPSSAGRRNLQNRMVCVIICSNPYSTFCLRDVGSVPCIPARNNCNYMRHKRRKNSIRTSRFPAVVPCARTEMAEYERDWEGALGLRHTFFWSGRKSVSPSSYRYAKSTACAGRWDRCF